MYRRDCSLYAYSFRGKYITTYFVGSNKYRLIAKANRQAKSYPFASTYNSADASSYLSVRL